MSYVTTSDISMSPLPPLGVAFFTQLQLYD